MLPQLDEADTDIERAVKEISVKKWEMEVVSESTIKSYRTVVPDVNIVPAVTFNSMKYFDIK